MSLSKLFIPAACVLALAACHKNPLIPKPNQEPLAVAQVIGSDGTTIYDPPTPVCPGVPPPPPTPAHEIKLDYPGSDITLTLDGSHSTDGDGHIVYYKWMSGTSIPDGGEGNLSHDVTTTTDGGTTTMHVKAGGRYVPSGDPIDWPNDKGKAKVSVTLGQGLWAFSLWVTDDRGAIGNPDSVSIAIGGDPRVKECSANVLQTVPEACRNCICGVSDTCRSSVVMSACDATCWGLIQCIGAKCPNFASMAMMGDFSCFTANCTQFQGGAAAAMAAGMCVTMSCMNECMAPSTADGGTPMPSDGGTAIPANCDAGKSSTSK